MSLHIRLSTKGTAPNIAKFHKLAFFIDNDWPWASRDPASQTQRSRCCMICHGREYHNPKLTAHAVKVLGRQAGVSVKIYRYGLATRCYARPEEQRFYFPQKATIQVQEQP